MRTKIFISHANPDDNERARWLGLQLIALGYDVWCDVFNLKGGDKFWKEIEEEIRTRTCKFLYVLTNDSNQAEGCLNELSVAEAVEKEIGDKRFIIALHYDGTLSHDSVNINLKRKIDVDFKSDWRSGLIDLVKVLEEEPIAPKRNTPDFDFIQNYWQTIFLKDRKPIIRDETFSSNWFPLKSFPEKLYFHNFKGMTPKKFNWGSMPYPTIGYKGRTVTFGWCYDFMKVLPDTEKYNPQDSISYNVNEILNDGFETEFIKNKTLRNLINNLIVKGFIQTMVRRNLLNYEMSKSTAFCFNEDTNDYHKFTYGQLVGKLKKRKWHYAFSGFPDLTQNVFVIKSHILFSDESGALIESESIQSKSRRKQGKSWWNRHWQQKLQSTISIISDELETWNIQVGEDAFVEVNSLPLSFSSSLGYVDPDEANEALDDFEEGEDELEDTIIENKEKIEYND